MRRSARLLASIVVAGAGSGMSGQARSSQTSAQTVVSLMNDAKLDSFITKLADAPDRYVSDR